jgi:hypothetical protein
MGVIWGKREGEYFWGRGWTGEIRLIGFRKLVFWRNGPAVENAARVARMSAAICGELDSEGARCRRVYPAMFADASGRRCSNSGASASYSALTLGLASRRAFSF